MTAVLPDANVVGSAAPTTSHDGQVSVLDDPPAERTRVISRPAARFDVVNVTAPDSATVWIVPCNAAVKVHGP